MKGVSEGSIPSDMKMVYSSLWNKAGNKLSELDPDKLKTHTRLDEAMAQLCVTLIERNQSKNVGVPNDAVMVK